MSLTRDQAGEIVKAVVLDSVCNTRINSAFMIFPPSWGANGQIRNMYNTILVDKLGDYSAKTESEMCVGISNAVTDAVFKKMSMIIGRKSVRNPKNLPWLKKIEPIRNDPAGFGHWGPKITTVNDKEYVFDWWMTLNIHNPIIFKYSDWRQYPAPGIASRGIQYSNFRGFDWFGKLPSNL